MMVVLFLLLLGIFIALPIYYVIISSVKPISELFYFPPRFYVLDPTTDNFLSLIKLQSQSEVPFERYLFNSVLVSGISTVGYVMLASMAAYALAKHKFPLKGFITQAVVIAILFRPEVTSVPQYNTPYGYLVNRIASCAGCARATGLCLNILGIPYEHVNENKWLHQWCRVRLDNGAFWISDAFGLYVGPEHSPYRHPAFPDD